MSRDRGAMRKRCEGPACDVEFDATRAAAKYCGERCKKRAQRRPDAPAVAPASVHGLPTAGREGPIKAATRLELEACGRVGSALGQVALIAASRLDDLGPAETGSGVKALIEAHRSALAEAVRDAQQAADPLEDIRRSAALKLIAGSA